MRDIGNLCELIERGDNVKRFWIPQVILFPLLLYALISGNLWKSDIFRWSCCILFICLTIPTLEARKFGWAIIFIVMAIIYNPIIRIPGIDPIIEIPGIDPIIEWLFRNQIWKNINLAAIVIVLVSIFALKPNK